MSSKDALQRLLDGLQTLMREHVALARLELKDDVRSMGRDLLASAAGVPALAAGYLLSMIAIGYLLALWLPSWAAFGIVALANLGAGGAVTAAGMRKVMGSRVGMPGTGEELQADKAWLASLNEGTRAGGDGKLAMPARSPRGQPEPGATAPANGAASVQ